jgi:hypothetical protein
MHSADFYTICIEAAFMYGCYRLADIKPASTAIVYRAKD